jgi:hypothetical protein
MGISQRIRTEIGINKTINVELQQDFNYLEILSLKIQQEDVYTKGCSDYGVVVGRVTANNGFGIPNAKVTVFIPIDNLDRSNPEIFSIYPYATPDDKNEDGYRFNLLSYEKSYTNHVPTGTFPSRFDSLTNQTAIYIYDKYYKFTVKTNESGDYMIMGVPLGVQIIFMDLDLSDMGEFSLTPQDLVRMGRATEGQVAGNSFKSSTNLNSLPQILSLRKSIDVSPLWGDQSICQIAINRVDFDLRDDANIDIQPTSVFMGSIVSSVDNKTVRTSCKPATELGNNCNLVAGPGQILCIRQTIFQDAQGLPLLEQYRFDGGDDVIDSDGAWLVDIPMNLDYVTINEFGERILSNDPKVGIPTKGKYRFKVKWKQSEDLGRSVVRANYLVPNIREYGWQSPANDPRLTPGSNQYIEFQKSYAFSLNWSDYVLNTGTTAGRRTLQSFVDCEDRFYPFEYNKVYTVSNFIDQYHKGTNRGRFIGIKQITDSACDSGVYKFPTNDGVRNTDILFSFINFVLAILTLILLALLPLVHVIAFIWPVLKLLFTFVYTILAWFVYFLCRLLDSVPFVSVDCQRPMNPRDFFDSIGDPFKDIKIPAITYPECEICECSSESINLGENPAATFQQMAAQNSSLSCLIDTQNPNGFGNIADEQMCLDDITLGPVSGSPCQWIINEDCNCSQSYNGGAGKVVLAGNGQSGYWKRTPAPILGTCGSDRYNVYSEDLTLSERLNLFNTKGKYFDNLRGNGTNNPYGGWNQVRVYVRPDLNPPVSIPGSPRPPAPNFHYDNVMAIIVDEGCSDNFAAGRILSFDDPSQTKDVNVLSGRTVTFLNNQGDETSIVAITGTSKNISSVTYQYADPQGPDTMRQVTYRVDQTSGLTQLAIAKSGGNILSFNPQLPTTNQLLNGTYPNLQSTTVSLGQEATFNVTVTNGVVVSVTISNPGYDYEINDEVSISGNLFSGVEGGDDILITVNSVSSQQFTSVVLQKYPTDIEYFQVITATTYGNFIKLNPPIPIGDYNTPTIPFYNSLKYRFTDNFQTIGSIIPMDIEIQGLDGCNPNYGKRDTFNTDDHVRPIYAMPDQKQFYIVFLMRGVDPNSCRQKTQVDVSKLFGHSYGKYIVESDLKLNIPIQPGLVLPRHNQIQFTTSTSKGRRIFYDSYLYNPTEFTGFSSNFIANYSALDKDTAFSGLTPSPSRQNFRVDDTQGISQLDDVKYSDGFDYLATSSQRNLFVKLEYFDRNTPYKFVWNGGAWSNRVMDGCEPDISVNNQYTFNLDSYRDTPLINTTGKQHRGYYDFEYIEGGSYFYAEGKQNYKFIGRRRERPFLNCEDGTTFYGPELLNTDYVYFSPAYPTGTTTTFQNNTPKIVMRTDRLPTSSFRNDTQGNNTFLLHQNRGFSFFFFEDDGTVGASYADVSAGYTSGDFSEDTDSQFEQKIQSTFTCGGMVPLNCYQGNGETFGVKNPPDSCYDNPSIIKNGCYVLVTKPIVRLGKDIKSVAEWKSRFKVNMAACRGLFGHSFYNNWINGTLFMPPLKNNRFFTRPSGTSSGNKPFNKFCEDIAVLQDNTNSFFYRSSPYTGTRFVGKSAPRNSRNSLQLLYPTTIMDMGPRDELGYELTLSENYFGYNMNKMKQTSYQDVSNILNLFLISRQISASFWAKLFTAGDASVATFFSRKLRRFDGDYAQAISINSEIGVEEFDFETYDYSTGTTTGQNTFYIGDRLIGIFFSSDTQTRDLVSPRRIIRNDSVSPGVYDNLPMFSQEVPMYKWGINFSNDSLSIFGDEENDWKTSSSDVQKFRYQSLDRTKILYNYFMGYLDLPLAQNGYIFNLRDTGGNVYVFEGDQVPGQVLVNPSARYTVGAPYFFYFGLYRGNNALDKFNVKYLGFETLQF